MNSLFNKVYASVVSLIPAEIMPDSQYAQSFAAYLMLIITADQEPDDKDFIRCVSAIESDSLIKRTDVTELTIDFLRIYLDVYENNYKIDKKHSISLFHLELMTIIRKCPTKHRSALRQHIKDDAEGASATLMNILARIQL